MNAVRIPIIVDGIFGTDGSHPEPQHSPPEELNVTTDVIWQ